MNTDIKLKDGYSIFLVTVFFEHKIHCVGYGFTSSIDIFVVAKDEAHCEAVTREKYAKLNIALRRAIIRQALKQDISDYVFYERFAGFADGCTHDDFPDSLYKREELKALSNRGYEILVRASSSGVEAQTLVDLAKEFRAAWGALGFWNKVTQGIQRSCTQFLDQIISGEIDPIKEQERFYSLTGLFNQTYGEACNYRVL